LQGDYFKIIFLGDGMKTYQLFLRFGLILALTLFIAPRWTQAKQEKKGPIITHAYAVEKGYYGYVWKIYIEAEDPDGDMDKIAVVVDQVGFGHHPTDWIILKPQYQGHFIGYLQWNTFSSKASSLPEWTRITAKVSVFDRAGNGNHGCQWE
jgi:hypothetical protein